MRDSNFKLYAKKSSPLSQIKNLEKEIKIMRRFRNHPNIVQASNYLLYLPLKSKLCHIYMEFASKGTLHNMISSFHGRSSMLENMIRRAAFMILQERNALHSNGYVHCDLKPANILVFPSTREPWNLKLADFGLSKEPFTDSRSTLLGGTEQYMSLESYGPSGVIGQVVDIWSLGCMVIEMFGGFPEKMKNCYMWRLPKLVSPVANDFLMQCLALEPSRRAIAAELLNYLFLAQRVIVPQPVMLMYPSSFIRFPCAIMNNVMEEFSRRPGGEVVTMIPQL